MSGRLIQTVLVGVRLSRRAPLILLRVLLIVIGTALGLLIAWPVVQAVAFWTGVIERRRASRSIR